MMFSYAVLCAGVLLAVCDHVTGYPTGAPLTRCVEMRPGHGYMSDISKNPYRLEISPDYYSISSTTKVTITGGVYKGLLLQARYTWGTDPVGTWSIDNHDTKTIDCNGQYASAVTHSNTNDKPFNTTYKWHGPSFQAGNIIFIATVAQEKTTWWMNIKSDEISYKSIDVSPEPTPTTTKRTPYPYPRPSASTVPSSLGLIMLLISSLLTVYIMY